MLRHPTSVSDPSNSRLTDTAAAHLNGVTWLSRAFVGLIGHPMQPEHHRSIQSRVQDSNAFKSRSQFRPQGVYFEQLHRTQKGSKMCRYRCRMKRAHVRSHVQVRLVATEHVKVDPSYDRKPNDAPAPSNPPQSSVSTVTSKLARRATKVGVMAFVCCWGLVALVLGDTG